jgi:hypothetical protein
LHIGYIDAVAVGNEFGHGGLGKEISVALHGQVDGQCGLGTFLGLLYGGGAGLAILLSLTVYILIIAYRQRRTT